jgi:hypothetical protein
MTTWTVDSINVVVTTDDDVPLGQLRHRMQHDVDRWSRDGLNAQGLEFEALGSNAFIFRGLGYEIQATAPQAHGPTDVLRMASLGDWTEA